MAESLDIDALAGEIDARIRALPEYREEPVRAVCREYSERLRSASPTAVIALALKLIREHSQRGVAYDLVHYHRPALRSLGPEELEQLGQGINSWWSVDGFARLLSGPAWRDGQVPDELIQRWARSEDRWWRRAALVSTVALNVRSHGGKGDIPRTLAVCRMLAADHDDMVAKALSWALRELVVHDPEAVRVFLVEHEGVLAARVKREVCNKLETGLKNPRKGAAR